MYTYRYIQKQFFSLLDHPPWIDVGDIKSLSWPFTSVSQHLYGLRFYNDNMKNMIQLGPSNQKAPFYKPKRS